MASAILPGSGPASDAHIDVRYYGGLLWKSRVFVATAAALGLALGLLVAFAQTPEYRASVMIQIEPPMPAFMTVTDALSGNYWQNADFYNTQFTVLKSSTLGDKVLERLKLKDRPPFQGQPSQGAVFMQAVSVEPLPESRLVVVHVMHRDPKEAALWANALADVYIEETVSSRVEAARKAYEWLQERLTVTQKTMREAQEKLLKTYQGQDVFVPEGTGVSSVASSIAKLTSDLIDAQARRIVLEAALKQIAQIKAARQSLDAVPQFAADPAIAGLNGQIAQANNDLARLRPQYKEGHPEIQKLRMQIDQAQKAKDRQGAQIVAALRAELEQLQKREAELRGAIDEEKAQAASQSRKGVELETLRKEADSARSLYDVLLQKLNESDIASSMRSNNASVVERAVPASSPIRPDKRKIALAGMLLGMALGAGLVIGRDYLDNTMKNPEEIEHYLHLDLLAAVPRYGADSVHLATEAYQNLRTALIFASKNDKGEVVLVTSTVPQEGKTTTLLNLGKLLASSGEKTVLLDFDLRRAQVHARLGLPREPGITSFFVQHEAIDGLIQPTRVPNLFVMTAGPLPPNPPAILTRPNMASFMASLRQQFRWILVDSPPLASVTDALLLARHADMTVLVIQHNKADKKLIKRQVAMLGKVTTNLLGAVMNAVDMRAKSYHYYYHYQPEGAAEGRSRAAAAGPKPVAAGRKG